VRNKDYDVVRKVEIDGKKKKRSDGEFAIGGSGLPTLDFWRCSHVRFVKLLVPRQD